MVFIFHKEMSIKTIFTFTETVWFLNFFLIFFTYFFKTSYTGIKWQFKSIINKYIVNKMEIPHIQGQEQWLWGDTPHVQGQRNPSKTAGAGAAVRYPTLKGKGEAPARW